MKRFLWLLASLFLVAAVCRGQVDEIVDVIYEINNPPTADAAHAILSASHSDAVVAVAVLGDLLYFNGTGWARLPIGADTEVLTVAGTTLDWGVGGGGGGYGLIDNEGTSLTARTTVNFIGAGVDCVDDAGGAETDCTIAGGGGAPTTADYLVGTADAGLSAEIVVGTSPGGELGGTWASPTVDDGISITNLTLVTPALGTPSSGTLTSATGLPPAGVTFAVTNQVLCRDTAGAGAGEECATSAVLDMRSSTRGAILYRGVANWDGLSPSATVGVPILSAGAGADPAYGTVPTAGYTDDSVTLAKIANAAANSVLVGSGSAGTGTNYTEVTLGSGMAMTGTVLSSSASAIDNITTVSLFDEYVCGGPSSATSIGQCLGSSGITNTSGTAGTKVTTDVNTPGVAFISTSTSATGISSLHTTQPNSVLLVNGSRFRSRVQFSALSTTAEEYTAFIGMHLAALATNAAPTSGAWFTYHDSTASATPNWTITVDDPNTAATTADCAIAVAATTWTKLDINYESGVGVHFLVGGVECTGSPITTPLPTITGEEFRPYHYKIAKAAGTTAAELWIDYTWYGPTTVSR